YLGGEEVNSSPSLDFDRYAIQLTDLELDQAERQYPELLQIVRERVKRERDELPDTPAGRQLKQFWWRYFRARDELCAAIAPLRRCLVISRHSKHLCFA